MAKDAAPPSLYSLQQPEKLDKVLAKDRAEIDDCTPCRVMGASAFIGLGAYSYLSGHHQLQQQQAAILKSKSLFGMKSRQAGITGLATLLVGAGLYRLVS